MTRRFKKSTFKPKAERRIVKVGRSSVTFMVREFKRLGSQGAAHIWGAFGEATGSDGINVAGKYVGVRYRWERGHEGDEVAKLFESEGAARSFAMARVRAVKAAKAPQTVG